MQIVRGGLINEGGVMSSEYGNHNCIDNHMDLCAIWE